ncbi:MAG: extracellular solute-binding protein [Oscillospiraceae bacterium]|jgi:ABC-type glycerol-3-phosphate transport system substrate-binding protein|nr:extracellular solute-binding protein [Oscillospiraceae bacterium]
MKKLGKCLAAAVTLLSLLSVILLGCDGTAKPASSDAPTATGVQAEKIAFENVYTETPITIGLSGVSYRGLKSVGDRVYFYGNAHSDGDAAGTVVQRIISCDIDGGNAKTHWEQAAVDTADGFWDGIRLSAFDADTEGNIWLVGLSARANGADPDDPVYESTFRLIKLAPDGTELYNTDLYSPEGGELRDIYYIQTITHDSEGNIYLQSQDIYAFSADGRHAFTIRDPLSVSSYMGGVFTANTGEMMYMTQESTATSRSFAIKPIDFAAKSAGTAIKYNGSHYFQNIFDGSGEYLFYYLYSGLYGAKLDAATGTVTGEKIIDFVNSDISIDGSQIFASIDGGFIMATVEFGPVKKTDTTTVYRLTEDKNATLEGKTVLTLGVVYGEISTVTKFNKSSRTARIMIKDYSEYNTSDDYTRGQAQLDLDIIAGRAPDIIALPGTPEKYISKGLLADLTPFVDSGKHGVLRENLFENVLTVGSPDGKIYRIIPRFYVITLAGKLSIFGGRESITTAELSELADARPGAAIMQSVTAADWLTNTMWLGMSRYIDWESGTCAFNSREFIETLEFSKRFPKEIDYSALYSDQAAYMEYYRDIETSYSEERTLLLSEYMYGPRAAHDMDFLFGEKTALIGYPTAGGGNGNVIAATGGGYAISASSPNKDLAWEFICHTIDLANEDSGDPYGAMSIDKKNFKEVASAETVPLEERDFTDGLRVLRINAAGGLSVYSIYSEDEIDRTDPYFENYAITEEEAARTLQAIEGASALIGSDEQISKIIMEEAEAFWAGAKTAEETASVIQSRAALYVSESS